MERSSPKCGRAGYQDPDLQHQTVELIHHMTRARLLSNTPHFTLPNVFCLGDQRELTTSIIDKQYPTSQ
jgi:hypothetical protein